jgi:hypothetical protein
MSLDVALAVAMLTEPLHVATTRHRLERELASFFPHKADERTQRRYEIESTCDEIFSLFKDTMKEM